MSTTESQEKPHRRNSSSRKKKSSRNSSSDRSNRDGSRSPHFLSVPEEEFHSVPNTPLGGVGGGEAEVDNMVAATLRPPTSSGSTGGRRSRSSSGNSNKKKSGTKSSSSSSSWRSAAADEDNNSNNNYQSNMNSPYYYSDHNIIQSPYDNNNNTFSTPYNNAYSPYGGGGASDTSYYQTPQSVRSTSSQPFATPSSSSQQQMYLHHQNYHHQQQQYAASPAASGNHHHHPDENTRLIFDNDVALPPASTPNTVGSRSSHPLLYDAPHSGGASSSSVYNSQQQQRSSSSPRVYDAPPPPPPPGHGHGHGRSHRRVQSSQEKSSNAMSMYGNNNNNNMSSAGLPKGTVGGRGGILRGLPPVSPGPLKPSPKSGGTGGGRKSYPAPVGNDQQLPILSPLAQSSPSSRQQHYGSITSNNTVPHRRANSASDYHAILSGMGSGDGRSSSPNVFGSRSSALRHRANSAGEVHQPDGHGRPSSPHIALQSKPIRSSGIGSGGKVISSPRSTHRRARSFDVYGGSPAQLSTNSPAQIMMGSATGTTTQIGFRRGSSFGADAATASNKSSSAANNNSQNKTTTMMLISGSPSLTDLAGVTSSSRHRRMGSTSSILSAAAASVVSEVSLATSYVADIQKSKLFRGVTDDGDVELHLPMDDIRITTDPDLEDGMFYKYIEPNEDELFENYYLHALVDENQGGDSLSGVGAELAILGEPVMRNNSNYNHHRGDHHHAPPCQCECNNCIQCTEKHPLLPDPKYVINVDGDLYKRVLSEIADSRNMPCGLYYCGHHEDVDKPNIFIAVVIVVGMFLTMYFLSAHYDG